MRQFILNYELDDGKEVTFKFDETIDFDKYNKTILELYSNRIKKRCVVDVQTGEVMSLKKLRAIISNL